jgi:hypothetical protein
VLFLKPDIWRVINNVRVMPAVVEKGVFVMPKIDTVKCTLNI